MVIKRDRSFRFTMHQEQWMKWGGLAIMASGILPLLMALRGGQSPLMPLLFIAAFIVGTLLWLRSYCEFREDYLLVVLGPAFEKYYYRNITAIRLTKGLFAEKQRPSVRFALYYNRVLKKYVQPEDKEGFLKILKEKCPHAFKE